MNSTVDMASGQHRDGAWDCHVHVFDATTPVLPGHYRPTSRSLAEIESRAAADGVTRLVLVQPSVYGTDNSLMLRALRARGDRHRGVAVVAPDVTDAQLDDLHGAGVRGIRLNRVSPVGARWDPQDMLRDLAPRLRERHWHVQWYLQRAQLADLVSLQDRTRLTFVLDHLAGIDATTALDDPAWTALAALAERGAWVKLSGWYRLKASAPYDAIHSLIRRVAGMFGSNIVWGSDWPHTSLAGTAELPYAATWQPVTQALSPGVAEAVRRFHPPRLYW